MASRPAAVWPSRADVAARSVLATFGQRVWGIPLTHLGAVARPGNRHREWHYWWQAHFVDCLVDAAQRGSTAIPRGIVARHLASIWLRNGLRFRNDYYDDMAWRFSNKIMQPLLVVLDPTDEPAKLVTHRGQEFNFVIEGSITVVFDDKEIVLNQWDSIYFNPMHPHGQRCHGDKVAKFITIIAE